ncbi:MAG: TIGR00730 family Rossman fold protein [Alphaproteobacteria bacterium]
MALQTIAVYCGSSARVAPVYLQRAFEMGQLLAKAGINLVYGGGKTGLMGAVADGALAEKGRVLGFLPHMLQKKEKEHPGLTELHLVEDMHTRKLQMFNRAEAFIILPGGFGTLDEIFEILTWRQIALHQKPMVFVNVSGYWDPLFTLMQHMQQEQFIGLEHLQFAEVTSTPQEAFNFLESQQGSIERVL